MSLFVKRERLKQAVLNMHFWRSRVQSQASSHLISLLALLRKGINSATWEQFEEQDDFDFFDAYFQIQDPEFPTRPYFDTLTLTRRIDSHPHSNVATARKGTFSNSWQAAEFEQRETGTFWKLNPEFTSIVRERVYRKGGTETKPDALDFACWFLRRTAFPDASTSEDMLERFREEFNLTPQLFDELFASSVEAPPTLWGGTAITPEVELQIVRETSVAPAPPVAPIPAPIVQAPDVALLEDDNTVWQEVVALMEMGTSGIILTGPPGTGKSWLAQQIALKLTRGATGAVEKVQFHSSFGYEDFVEGYLPDAEARSGFSIVDKTFLALCDKAATTEGAVVLIIDEINRGDPSRVFGEVLTYMESGWRGVTFRTPFRNKEVAVPPNLLILATMNPHDRSITPLDMALLRRFDHVEVLPSSEIVEMFLSNANFPEQKRTHVVAWFSELQRILPFGIGHTYFLNINSIGRLRNVFRYRIQPFCKSVLEFEPEKQAAVTSSYEALEQRLAE